MKLIACRDCPEKDVNQPGADPDQVDKKSVIRYLKAAKACLLFQPLYSG